MTLWARDVTKTGNGERGTGNGERETGNGERATGNGKRAKGNVEWGKGKGKRGTGTGIWEQVYSGNWPENSKWRTTGKKPQKRAIWGNMRKFLPDVPLDNQYVLERAESDWYWDKRSMKWGLERKSNWYYHTLPKSVGPQPFLHPLSVLRA